MTGNIIKKQSIRLGQKSILALIFCNIFFLSATAQKIYVSPDGIDINQGTKNLPVHTIKTALNISRRSFSPNIQRQIILLPGTYQLKETIVLNPLDRNLTIKSEIPGKAIIKGSISVPLKWKMTSGGIYFTKMQSGIYFNQLFMNGERQIPARFPNITSSKDSSILKKLTPSRINSWKRPQGTILHTDSDIFVVRGISRYGQLLISGRPSIKKDSISLTKFKWAENVPDELDAQKEWFLNRTNSTLYYIPEAGILPQKQNFEISVLKNIIELRGTQRHPVLNVKIEGITFEQTQRTLNEKQEYLNSRNIHFHRGGALYLKGTSNCTIENCSFEDIGGNAIFASRYNQNLLIKNNNIRKIGANGICFAGWIPEERENQISESKDNQIDSDCPVNCIIENNQIVQTGMFEIKAVPIQIIYSKQIKTIGNKFGNSVQNPVNRAEGEF